MKPACLDSSAWIEILHGGPNAARFLKALGDPATAILPAICLYEVWKYTAVHADEARAMAITQTMRQSLLIPVDSEISLAAAAASIRHKLPMADALIYVTTLLQKASLWTQDNHFEGLPNVRYLPKIKA